MWTSASQACVAATACRDVPAALPSLLCGLDKETILEAALDKLGVPGRKTLEKFSQTPKPNEQAEHELSISCVRCEEVPSH